MKDEIIAINSIPFEVSTEDNAFKLNRHVLENIGLNVDKILNGYLIKCSMYVGSIDQYDNGDIVVNCVDNPPAVIVFRQLVNIHLYSKLTTIDQNCFKILQHHLWKC